MHLNNICAFILANPSFSDHATAMKLEKIEIKGFKSFADQVILTFDEPIIGVVGPNGSGKSNLVDAIKWVLGEQKNRELRTDSMESVIFNGTKTRKKSGRAHVSLYFYNESSSTQNSYQNIVISRTLFRSGESEYKLNGVRCRLKDIKSLFLDTGVGSNSYAIISLGMVDEILLDRENFRRKMIEQAAGIEKFKDRKHQTSLKLGRTQEDLDRLEDILHEVKKNMQALNSQANKAQRHKKLKEEYLRISLVYARHKIIHIKDQMKAFVSDQKGLLNEKVSLVSNINSKESHIEQSKSSLLFKEKELKEYAQSLSQSLEAIRNDEKNEALIKERLSTLERNLQSAMNNVTRAQNALATSKEKAAKLMDKIQTEETVQLDMHAALNKSKIDAEEAEKARNEIKVLVHEHEAQRANQQLKINEKEKLLHRKQVELNNAETNFTQMLDSRARSKTSLTKCTEELERIQAKILESDKIYNQILNEIEQTQSKQDSLNAQMMEAKNELQSIVNQVNTNESELRFIQRMIDELEGFPDAVKAILKDPRFRNRVRLLSDVFTVDEEYRSGIELYLGTRINAILAVDRSTAMEVAKQAIENSKGRVEIYYETDEPVKEDNIPAGHSESVISVLKSISSSRGILQTIFTSCYFTHQSSLSKDVQQDLVFIEKSGDRVFTHGRIIASKRSNSDYQKIGRLEYLKQIKDNIISLNESHTEKEKNIASLESEIEALDLKNLLSKKENIDRKRQDLARISAVENHKLTEVRLNIERLDSKIDQQKNSIAQYRSEWEELTVENKDLAKLEHSQSDSLSSLQDNLRELEHNFSKIRQEYNQLNIEKIQKDNYVQTLKKDLEYVSNASGEYEKIIANDRKKEEDAQSSILELTTQLEDLSKKIQLNYESKQLKSNELNAMERLFHEEKAKISQLENSIREDQRKLRKTEDELSKINDVLSQLGFEQKELENALAIEFGNNVIQELSQIEIDHKQDCEKLIEIKEKLRSKIQNFGEFNPMAVQAFEETRQRYESLEEQMNDIYQAKEKLIKTIDEIEIEATDRFESTLEKVRANFKTVFRELFTDDDECDLLLENSEDIMNTRIQITAKPKGKRPQSINQLSGGEKTLTATAFLFSLYLLKPAPFCIFDEVDAPLDDHNILKFNKIIKKFSERSQFIIITHNKLTMANVDVIYGITMGEQGVSQVSGVDFRHLDNPALLN